MRQAETEAKWRRQKKKKKGGFKMVAQKDPEFTSSNEAQQIYSYARNNPSEKLEQRINKG